MTTANRLARSARPVAADDTFLDSSAQGQSQPPATLAGFRLKELLGGINWRNTATGARLKLRARSNGKKPELIEEFFGSVRWD